MGFSPRVYEIQLYLQEEEEEDTVGDWWWEPQGEYGTLAEATKWFNLHKGAGCDVRLVETKIVKAYEDGKLYS